jgi:hypothetical protein
MSKEETKSVNEHLAVGWEPTVDGETTATLFAASASDVPHACHKRAKYIDSYLYYGILSRSEEA